MKKLFIALMLISNIGFAEDISDLLVVTDPAYDSVALLGVDQWLWFEPQCTGVLVSERVVLTALHCITGYQPDSVSFFTDQGRILRRISKVARLIETPRKFPSLIDSNGNQNLSLTREERIYAMLIDLVAITLDREVEIEPMPILNSSTINSDEKTLPLSAVGFPSRYIYGLKPDGTTAFARNPVSNLKYCYIQPEFKYSDQMVDTDCIVTPGNSGGPIVTVIDGIPHLVGISIVSTHQVNQNLLGRNLSHSVYLNISHPNYQDWMERVGVPIPQ